MARLPYVRVECPVCARYFDELPCGVMACTACGNSVCEECVSSLVRDPGGHRCAMCRVAQPAYVRNRALEQMLGLESAAATAAARGGATLLEQLADAVARGDEARCSDLLSRRVPATAALALMAAAGNQFGLCLRLLRALPPEAPPEDSRDDLHAVLLKAADEGAVDVCSAVLGRLRAPDAAALGEALWQAVGGGHTRAAALLLKYGAADASGGRILNQAADCEGAVAVELTRLLLQHGARPDRCADCEALIIAALRGNLELCRLLIASGADPQRFESAALASAAGQGHLQVCGLLLESGAVASDRGNRAIIQAAVGGHADVCVLLKKCGADPRAVLERSAFVKDPQVSSLFRRKFGVRLSKHDI